MGATLLLSAVAPEQSACACTKGGGAASGSCLLFGGRRDMAAGDRTHARSDRFFG